MARVEQPVKKVKQPNRVKQMWDVFQMTRKHDNRAIPYLLLGFIPPIIAGFLLGFLLPGTSVLTEISRPDHPRPAC
jgi:hypothetical protein